MIRAQDLIKTFICISLVVLFLSACSKNSGDSSSDGQDVVYTGKTTPAVITSANASEIVVAAMKGADTKSFTSLLGGVQTESPPDGGIFSQINMVGKGLVGVQRALEKAEPTLSAVTDTVAGSCGGSVQITDTDSGGTVRFSNFCDDGEINTSGLFFSGTMTVVGLDGEGNSGSVSLSNFRVFGAIGSARADFSMSGNMSVTLNSATGAATTTMSLVYQDNVLGQQFKVQDFSVLIASAGTSVNGRVYLAVEGYVDVTTVAPVKVDSSGPVSGQVRFTGSNAYADVKYSSGGRYTVSVDGVAVKTGNWSDLGVAVL